MPPTNLNLEMDAPILFRHRAIVKDAHGIEAAGIKRCLIGWLVDKETPTIYRKI
jgi:hypothetical protein